MCCKKKKYIRFFNRAGRLLGDDWTTCWDNISYVNLIQHVFTKGNDQPKSEHIATIKSFYRYLELLKPDKVIVCSNRMWNIWFGRYIDNLAEGVICTDKKMGISTIFKYPYKGGYTQAIGINHTSSRETGYIDRWKPHVTDFLNS